MPRNDSHQVDLQQPPGCGWAILIALLMWAAILLICLA